MSPGRSQFRRTEVHRSLFLFFFPSSLLCFHFLELTLYLYFWIFARGVGLRSAVLRFLRRACSSIRLVFFSVNGLTFQTLNQTLPLKVTMKIKKTVIVLMILKPKVSGFSNLSLHNFLKSKENYISDLEFQESKKVFLTLMVLCSVSNVFKSLSMSRIIGHFYICVMFF